MSNTQLFMLPFAGGNCYSFDFLAGFLKDRLDLVPLELPGRGKRTGERLIGDFHAAAGDISSQIMRRINSGRFLIYGHSLGAYLTLKVANILHVKGMTPFQLIVSGNAGPGVYQLKNRHLYGSKEFKAELKSLGGVPQEIFENEELFAYFEPILRADFKLAEIAGMELESPATPPLFAIMGNREEHVDRIANWGKFTKSSFDYRILEGGHFFIYDHPEQVASIIRDLL